MPPVITPSPTPAQPPRPTPPLSPKPMVRHHRLRWTVVSIVAVVLVILGIGGWIAYRAISVVNTKKTDGSRVSFFQQLTHLVTTNNEQLQGEADDRINILLLGYGGPGHDGPYLTDTMMVMSVKPSTKQVALISIPRDLVVNIPGQGYRKINSALSVGRDKKYPGGGEALAVKVVSDTLNIPIQYYGRIDFQGFKDVIDQVHGISVTVDTAFTDYSFPDNAYGYQTISFKTGTQVMTGTTALNFARSRHGNNGEGSDFARAKRQQKIIEGLKDKLLSLGTLSNPKKISDILGTLGSHSQTNMEVWEMLRLAKMVGGLQSDQIINTVYDDSANGFLKAATGLDGAFILVPRDGTYHDMQFMANNVFTYAAAKNEQANVAIANATVFTTIGANTARGLAALGLTIVKNTTLTKTTVGQTVIVANQPGRFPQTERLLSAYVRSGGVLSATNWASQTNDQTLTSLLSTAISISGTSTVITNGHTITTNTSTAVVPDIIVVLGQDQPKPTTTGLIPVATPGTNTNGATNANANTNASANKNTKTSTSPANVNGANANGVAVNTNTSTNATNSHSVQ